MVTPLAVLTAKFIFPNPYTGAIKVAPPSWRGNRWVVGSKRFAPDFKEEPRLGLLCHGVSDTTLRSPPCPSGFNGALTRTVARDDARNGVHCLARRAEAKVNLGEPPIKI